MKTATKFWMILMAAVLTIGLVSCSDPEEGEDWDTWIMRNMLDSGWSLDQVKVNGNYKSMGEPGFDFYFYMDLKANGRKFDAKRFFYKDYEKDDATEVLKSGTFTIVEKNKAIEATDSDGKKFFRLESIEFGTGSMTATITFYDLNQTYDVILSRSATIKN